ncbi:HlyD family efflux transporter periplasmic adaptor subunit [Shewanella sp. VB17]|uniref:HlyD family secretion protein n=1 Tax=Shewanella sp. VB17 TaxID=2739432 RepID=UPI0015645E43|nr:HlyD family efflux transporter periplasmic adaptor subunit [Shewanella sp. VB17]NRD72641.1 HlyD family efflux transporter periplasmic adaptor subunit [Shewanella sp. VB17]
MKPLLFIFFIMGLSGCQDEVTHQALGTLERDRVLLRATASEIIIALPQKEGNKVVKGQLLVQFDPRKQRTKVAIAQAEVSKAQYYLLRLTNGERPEDIASAQANVARTQAALIEAKQSYQRSSSLLKKNLTSQATQDTAKANKDKAQAELNVAKENLAKLIAGVRVEDINQAKAAMDASIANLSLEQQTLDELSVIATRSGRLDSLPFNLGERVPAGAVIVAIQADNAPYARVYIPEPYMAKLTIGQQMKVRIDGIETVFTGTLRRLSKEPAFTPYYALNQQDRSRLVFLAEIDLGSDADTLPTGIPSQVDLPL